MDKETSEIHTEQALESSRQEWREHWEEKRSHARYPLGTPFAGELHLDNGHYPPMPLVLIDVSAGGACLLMSYIAHLQRGESAELRTKGFEHPTTGDLSRRRVWVCWQEPREWLSAVGVAFVDPLGGGMAAAA